jgi:cysteine synthase
MMKKTAHVAASAMGLIGQTPVVELSRIWGGPGRILAKAEFLQPGGSVKDRAARAIIEAARADGRLKPSAPVVEMTSGNMGAGLAAVCLHSGILSSSPCRLETAHSVHVCSKRSAPR